MTFIEHITQVLTQQGLDHLKDYTLVFPMQRAELYFKQQFQRMLLRDHIRQPLVLPHMVTIDQLVDDLSDLRLCDEIRSVCLLFNLYTSLVPQSKPLSLDAFYGWGKQLLQDFNNIDMARGDTRRIVSNLSDAKKLDEAIVDPELRNQLLELINLQHADERMQEFFHQLWEQLPTLYDRFTEQQTLQGVGTRGQCYKDVINHFDDKQARLEERTYVFIGFNYLLPAEREIMTLFHKHQQTLFFWDNDPAFDAVDPSVYQFIQENIRQFGNAMDRFVEPPSQPQPKPITAISATSVTAQVQYVTQWLRTHHHAGERSAVVITDESVLESVLYALPEELSDKVNITKGYPLKSTAIYAQVVSWLSDKTNDRLPNETTYSGVLSRLEQYLPVPTPAPDQSATWQQVLGMEAYCQTLMVLHRFMALCDEGVLTGVTELRTMRNLIRRCLDTISIPFHGEPVEEVQIIGVLETRLLDFDNILILNVEEGVVPAKAADNSFIPFDLRKAYHMQTHDEEAKIYAYNFFRLIRRAQNVTLIFCEAAGNMSKKSMSRFLMQILLSDAFRVTKQVLQEGTESWELGEVDVHKTWISKLYDSNGQPKYRQFTLPDGKPYRQPVLSLSPSALNTYIECPRQFYLAHVLGLQQTAEPSMIFAPNDLGSFFHGAIEHAYKTICQGDITTPASVPVKAIQEYIAPAHWQAHSDEALQAGFQEIIDNYNKHHDPPIGADIYHYNEHLAEAEVVRTMLYNVLQYDAEHSQNLTLVGLEKDYRRLIHRTTPDGKEVDILLGGVIDRLDYITEDGVTYLRILDYKTGSYKASKVAAKSIQDLFCDTEPKYVLQTLIYSSVCAEYAQHVNPQNYPIMPQLVFTQKLSADKHLQLAGQPINHFVEQQEAFEKELTKTIDTMLSEPIQGEPWKQTQVSSCQSSFCPFHLICGREKKEW